MATEASPRSGEVVELAPAPASRLWVALVLGVGAAILGAAAVLVLGEVFLALKRPVLEALLVSR